MGQIPRSTERISSIFNKVIAKRCHHTLSMLLHYLVKTWHASNRYHVQLCHHVVPWIPATFSINFGIERPLQSEDFVTEILVITYIIIYSYLTGSKGHHKSS